MPVAKAIFGISLLMLGGLHLATRDRNAESRSVYTGGMRFSRTARTVIAVIELALGALLLLTAF